MSPSSSPVAESPSIPGASRPWRPAARRSRCETQELQGERNSRSRLIGQAKKAGEEVAPLLAQVADLGDKLKAAEAELAEVQNEV